MNKSMCSINIQSQYWCKADDTPNHNFWVYGYFPEIGNDDDGYGYVDLVYFNSLSNCWYDRNGKSNPKPSLWCALYTPENPYIYFDTPEEAEEFKNKLAKEYPNES